MEELVGPPPDAIGTQSPRFTPDQLTHDAGRIAVLLNGGVVVAPSVVLQPLSPGEWIASYVPGATPDESGVIDMSDDEHALGGTAFSFPITRDTEPTTRFQDGLLAAAGFAGRTQGDILYVADVPNDKVLTLESVNGTAARVAKEPKPAPAVDMSPGVEETVAEPQAPKRRSKKIVPEEAKEELAAKRRRRADNYAHFSGPGNNGIIYDKGVPQQRPPVLKEKKKKKS